MAAEFRYASGEPVRLGDQVAIDSAATGAVVGIVHERQYSGAHKPEHWDQYGSGVLVESKELGLVLYGEPDDFVAVRKIEL